MLAILVGCGLRRAELANLPFEKIQIRQGHWVIVDLVGKGGHVRTIPIPRWAKEKLDLHLRPRSAVDECSAPFERME